MSHQAIGDKLVKREIHLAVVAQLFKSGKLDFDLLFTDELVLVVAAGHSWATRGRVSPAELRQQNWILSDKDIAANSLLSADLKTQGIALEELRSEMRWGESESVLAAVEAGQGVAFVSLLAAHQNLESGRIQVIQVEGMVPLRRGIYLAYCKKGETPAQSLFRKFIQAAEGQSLIAKFALVPQED
jgi:DNA-binding transcriptional LysR family regulator